MILAQNSSVDDRAFLDSIDYDLTNQLTGLRRLTGSVYF
jgi:hypothetical protein